MSLTVIMMIVGAVLLALAWLFLVAVLRSHAEILRRLGAIERRLGDAGSEATVDQVPGDGYPASSERAVPAAPADSDAPDIVGETLAGDAVKLALGSGAPRTLLAFLSSGCAACEGLWAGLGDAPASADVRVVLVTKGPDRESVTRLRRLGSQDGGTELLMSTAAWRDFSITATPHFVLVDGGSRRILGRGAATSWTQIGSLLSDAKADGEWHRARSTSQRAARAEQALTTAGIVPGHSSLYPSRPDEDASDDRP
jgi:hypothetical protein